MHILAAIFFFGKTSGLSWSSLGIFLVIVYLITTAGQSSTTREVAAKSGEFGNDLPSWRSRDMYDVNGRRSCKNSS